MAGFSLQLAGWPSVPLRCVIVSLGAPQRVRGDLQPRAQHQGQLYASGLLYRMLLEMSSRQAHAGARQLPLSDFGLYHGGPCRHC